MKITFADKVSTIISSLPIINRIRAEDINEIKQVVNYNADATVPIGSGFDFYGTTAPDNYMFADGSAISRTTYADLFAVIGTTYGSGDGSTTFNLPDKRERVSVMYKENSTKGTTDASFGTMGAKGGEDKHQLSVAELPTHSTNVRLFTDLSSYGHSGTAKLYGSDGTATSNAGNGDAGLIGDGKLTRQTGSSFTTYSSNNSTGLGVLAGTTTAIGSGTEHNNLQPYLVCNYIIRIS